MKSILVMALTTMGFATAQAVTAQTTVQTTVQVTKGHVEFLAIGKPSAIKIRGKGDDLKSEVQWKEKQLSGKFKFNLESLDTGIGLRTNHMKEKYLETGKFKNAELELKAIAFTQDLCTESLQLMNTPFEGRFKLHGIEQAVKGEFDVKSEKGKGHTQVRFNLNITDYKIEIPVYLGIKVADQVQNTVDLDWSCVQ